MDAEAATWALVRVSGFLMAAQFAAAVALVIVTALYVRKTQKLVEHSEKAANAASASADAASASVEEMRVQSGRMDEQVEAARGQVEQMQQQVLEAQRTYQASLLALADKKMAKYDQLFVRARDKCGADWPDSTTINPYCHDVDAIALLVQEKLLPLKWVVSLYGNDLLTVWNHLSFKQNMNSEDRRERFKRLVWLCEACAKWQHAE